jgi:tRNA-(ms[2]io[6]A)-hydroxylase
LSKNIEEILTDHAWCEQKHTNAITIITNNSEHQDLVQDLGLAKEEMDHFEQVHISSLSGLKLGERKDHYVNELYLYMKKNSNGRVSSLERLLFGDDRKKL